jgi:hypothetical protein
MAAPAVALVSWRLSWCRNEAELLQQTGVRNIPAGAVQLSNVPDRETPGGSTHTSGKTPFVEQSYSDRFISWFPLNPVFRL